MMERPILFSTDMVKAILEGRKTQTRRIIKPQPEYQDNTNIYWGNKWCFVNENHIKNAMPQFCPYGGVGDRLWVRETWAYQEMEMGSYSDWRVIYKADNHGEMERENWKPSIHMFRKDSRITREITELWVERLRDISAADAQAEGGYTIEEFISLYLKINHLPADANPWNWVISFNPT